MQSVDHVGLDVYLKAQKIIDVKFIRFLFAEIQNCYKFASDFVPWCNGNTPVFGIVIQGSSPCGTTDTNP